MPVKVILADDSDIMRSVMRKTLQEEPRIEVVGEASNFAKTVQLLLIVNLTCCFSICTCPNKGRLHLN